MPELKFVLFDSQENLVPRNGLGHNNLKFGLGWSTLESSSDSNMPLSTTHIVHPVAIIGGGPVGLSASILLSLRNIPHILLERHTGTSIHPKACGINQRTTEIFRLTGIYDELRAVACPDDVKTRTAWYTSLGSDDDDSVSGAETLGAVGLMLRLTKGTVL